MTPEIAAPAALQPASSSSAKSHRLPASTIVATSYLLLSLLLTIHLWSDPAALVVAGNSKDADQFSWFMRYAATAVAHGHLPALVTTTLNAAPGVNMMWNTSVLIPGILLAPVTLFLGPQVSLTILMTVGFAGSATAMFWVLRRWQLSLLASIVAGTLYGFSPALLHAAVGHYDLQFCVLPPLIIDAGLRLVCRPAPKGDQNADGVRQLAVAPPNGLRPLLTDGARLGVLVSIQLFISEELLLTTALTGALLAAWLAGSHLRTAVRRSGRAATGIGISILVSLAICGHALLIQFAGPLPQHGALFKPNFFVNDLTSFVTPSKFLLFHTSGTAAAAALYQGGAPEYVAYLGWPLLIALLLAMLATWRSSAARAMR